MIEIIYNGLVFKNPDHLIKDKNKYYNLKDIKNGIIKKQPCEICGDNKVHAHHEKYGIDYELRWLCYKHHKLVHRLLRNKLHNVKSKLFHKFCKNYPDSHIAMVHGPNANINEYVNNPPIINQERSSEISIGLEELKASIKLIN